MSPIQQTFAKQQPICRAEGDKGNQKEAIIAILEEWAAWERGLEEEAEKAKVAGDIKEEIEGELAPPVDEPTPMVEINASLERNPKSSQCIVTEFDDSSSAIEITPIPRRNARGGSKKVISGTTGQLYATKRDRRRAEKNDPLAKSRREALKVWTADQTRRRSSAGDWPPSHSQVEAGLSLKDWVARRRNSAEAIADQLEGGGGGIPAEGGGTVEGKDSRGSPHVRLTRVSTSAAVSAYEEILRQDCLTMARLSPGASGQREAREAREADPLWHRLMGRRRRNESPDAKNPRLDCRRASFCVGEIARPRDRRRNSREALFLLRPGGKNRHRPISQHNPELRVPMDAQVSGRGAG